MAKMVVAGDKPQQQIAWTLRESHDGVHLVGDDGKKTKTVIEIREDGVIYLTGYATLNGLQTDEAGCAITERDC